MEKIRWMINVFAETKGQNDISYLVMFTYCNTCYYPLNLIQYCLLGEGIIKLSHILEI